jgi:hypothetical protein
MSGRITSFLRSHPKLCLFLLTPGIVEYISGSSPTYFLVLSPFYFGLQLALNAALYLPGALLIREAMIRWKKGWASVLLLGAAYGILEEGIALGTLFNMSPVEYGSGPATYGQWMGVSWVWAVEATPLHMIYSAALPILLLGLALPSTRGKSLLESRRSLVSAGVILGADAAFINLAVQVHLHHTEIGWPLFGLSALCIGALVLAARLAPARILKPRTDGPKVSPLVSFVLGAAVYAYLLVVGPVGASLDLPAIVTAVGIVALLGFYLFLALETLGRGGNTKQLLAYSLGLIVPPMVAGAAMQIFLPLVLVLDVAALLFFRKLWRNLGNGPDVPSSQNESPFYTKFTVSSDPRRTGSRLVRSGNHAPMYQRFQFPVEEVHPQGFNTLMCALSLTKPSRRLGSSQRKLRPATPA